MATVTESKNIVLDSRLVAYESEIIKLKKNNKDLKIDTKEAKESLDKLTKELKISQDNLSAFQTENKTLKLSLKDVTNKCNTQENSISEYINKNNQLTIRVEENDKEIQKFRKQQEEYTLQMNSVQCKHKNDIRDIEMSHAKEIGKVQNNKQNELDERVNRFAKIENNLKTEITVLTKQMDNMDREYKDTIAAQAQRLCAYEHQINIMEKQMNRLSIQNEFKSIPKVTDNERQIHHLERQNVLLQKDNEIKSTEIQDLVNRLNMTKLNQHYDFRNRGTF